MLARLPLAQLWGTTALLALARRKPDRYLILSWIVLLHKKLTNRGSLKQTNLALGWEDDWLPYIINTLAGLKNS
jgi:hypothetical protein